MAFEIHEVSERDFPALVRCMWETYEKPPQHLFRIFCPLNAAGCSSRDESIAESTARLWDWHVSDPSSHWLKVIDAADGSIVGGALWKLNRTDPYAGAHGDDEEAYWQPAGGQRDFANQVLATHEEARAQMARRPHVYLNIIFTHPDHQRKGIGALIMDWGVAKAKEMGVEMWINAWRYGIQLYERYGFVTVEHHVAKPTTDNPDDAWRACERELTDLEEWVMWRPKDGPYVEGKSVKPWEVSK